ncbi:MAG: class I SAM-dependent methyltransferase [Candidatus Staskawiczbacteria bacterium]|nr:class I SAM-dependent methyltransferase [Candidatus Staskawiczbacteria bacterium]
MKKNIKNWWNNASSYYQDTFNIPVDDIYYGPFCPTEKKLKIIDVDNIKNKKILELGCGGGQCGIFLSKKGAICDGIDISERQIQYAIELAKKNKVKINYHVGSGEDLSRFKNSKFDIVLSVFAMQYINNLDKCFCDINKILKKGGRFIFSLDNPFYSVMCSKTMKIEGDYNHSGLRETIKTSDIINPNKWPKGDIQKFIFYFRKVSDIYKSLVMSNFLVEEIKEPILYRGKNPWNKIYSRKLSRYVAPTIIFIAKK